MTTPQRVFEPPDILRGLARLVASAGDATLDAFRRADLEVHRKADDSPVTEADLASQGILVEGLGPLLPETPIIAEESAAPPWTERKTWRRAWLVDPLDGTREFVSGRGEFTVNVALVEDGQPVLGAVRAPVLGVTWLGCAGWQGRSGAWRLAAGSDAPRPIAVSRPAEPIRIVASRSHRSRGVDEFLRQVGAHELVSMGSSLKLCVLAEGGADLYPRLGRTMEWDTAAANAVLRGAGGSVLAPGTDGESREPLRYNKEDLANPFFLAAASAQIPWQDAWRAAWNHR